MVMRTRYMTSESVRRGHPDKVCDQISDAVLDAYLAQDAASRVAVETFASNNCLMIAGEVTSSAKVNLAETARSVLRDIGYKSQESGLDGESCLLLCNVHQQSADIDLGVSQAGGRHSAVLGGGDQGIMYGYATNETANYMPLTCNLAHGMARMLDVLGQQADFLRPDGKTQATMKFDEMGRPQGLSSVVVSVQHAPEAKMELLRELVRQAVIQPVCGEWLRPDTVIHINPTGRFVIGGPAGDTGLTGRKIMVDSYGSLARHGGGAFSGKDATKVDRSAAYMARYAAKNIVAAGLADRCEVSIAYVIGSVRPEAVFVETFGSEKVPVEKIEQAVAENFSFGVADIIETLALRKPIFRRTAAYGHFGREDQGFAWECLDKKEALAGWLRK